jgi:hypothetical protein
VADLVWAEAADANDVGGERRGVGGAAHGVPAVSSRSGTVELFYDGERVAAQGGRSLVACGGGGARWHAVTGGVQWRAVVGGTGRLRGGRLKGSCLVLIIECQS